MRWLLLITMLIYTTTLSAESCTNYDTDYSMALDRLEDHSSKSARDLYDITSKVIDTGLLYLSYCKESILFGDQHQIRQTIKRADKKRRDYFTGAVREYHNIYGIRPNVTEIYHQ